MSPINVIELYASQRDVWDLIDPSKAPTEKPPFKRPVQPVSTTVNKQAPNITNLNPDEVRVYSILNDQYKTDLRDWKDRSKALAAVGDHIIATVGSFLGTIQQTKDVATQLILLKARVEPTSYDREREVLARMKTILKGPSRTKLETWVTSWRKVLTEAQSLELSDSKDIRPTLDFLDAVSQTNPSFSIHWER
ncbi:hypothetical protein EDB80DRAFT_782969 [Ilyonectria destructans]|nr:hypothetical protein EDB80DRAFT_782969 [Ilyonectria destructans]